MCLAVKLLHAYKNYALVPLISNLWSLCKISTYGLYAKYQTDTYKWYTSLLLFKASGTLFVAMMQYHVPCCETAPCLQKLCSSTPHSQLLVFMQNIKVTHINRTHSFGFSKNLGHLANRKVPIQQDFTLTVRSKLPHEMRNGSE